MLAGLSAALVVAVPACSSEPSAVYADTWQAVDPNDPSVVTIERNNDNFWVDLENDDDPNNDVIFHLENGALVFKNEMLNGGMRITHVEPSDQAKFEFTGGVRAMAQLDGKPTEIMLERE
ncbi:hypothetical protein S4A8_02793 [Salinisphaera sp. S4-8]